MKSEKIKPSYDSNRSILGEIFPLSTPFNVILDVSEVCNFRCGYCFRGQDDKSKWGYASRLDCMEWGLFEKAVDQLKDFPEEVRQISLSNHGEPLCNRKVPDMVRYIKSKGIGSRVSIHTNGTMLDEEYARDLADSDIDRIVVSLQGLTAEKYREICRANINFESFYHNLSVLYQNKKKTQIHFKIMDIALENGEEEKFYELFSTIGDRVYIEKVVPIWKDVEISSSETGDEAVLLYNKYGDRFRKQECCPLIFHTTVVVPNGDVYPCTQLLNPYTLGNIQEQTLVKLWNSSKRRELLVAQCEKNNPDVCRECFILQNSIYTAEDMIDDYRDKILERILGEQGYE